MLILLVVTPKFDKNEVGDPSSHGWNGKFFAKVSKKVKRIRERGTRTEDLYT